ncbi:MAG: DUF1553 domain-containing protein [Planctomycetaceae bacterium]
MTKVFRIAIVFLTLLTSRVVAQNADEIAFFEKKIRPVLVQHCYKCHAADSKNVRGGLLLDTRAGSRKGGDSGPAVVPHKLDESLLIESIRYDGYEMPPSGKLPAEVIADFEKWIEMGAPDPRDGEAHSIESGMDVESGRKFWSFRRPTKPAVPTVETVDWPRGDIDRFILAAIEREGLKVNEDATRRAFLRRVYFDLLGLPPTTQQLHAFLEDESPQAFEHVVDGLLASPHFGERWGRHWLDIARYSDSTGGGRSLLFKVAWRYRNYVIDALNRDTPFDRFIVEQIAGDLMPASDDEERSRQLKATAFLALGPTNYENQDKRQLRMDVVDEQIDTIGRAFLGMTIGCARCHDHKFDPIPTKDYYALAGVFRSTRSLIDGNVSNWITRPLPASGTTPKADVAKAKKLLNASKERLGKLQKQLPTMTVDDTDARLVGDWKESTFVKGFVGKRYLHTNDRDAAATFSFQPNNRGGRYRVLASYTPGTNRETRALFEVRQGDKAVGEARLNQRVKPKDQFVLLGEYDLHPKRTVSVTLKAKGTADIVIVDAVQLQFVGGADSSSIREQLATAQKETESLQRQFDDLKKLAKEQRLVLSVEEEKEPADFHVCIRGNVRRLGDKVPRGVLSVAATNSGVLIPAGASGRLEVAQWIASAENPLTARVAVNRIWSQLFGTGIVRTVDNFGIPGERPSHPALLDFLANQFVEDGWSVKQMIRRIVLSRTYRLSSTPNKQLTERDPENLFFARQNRRRLQAESLRDAMFWLSGELNLEPAGDTVRPGTKSGYGYQFTSQHRSVYLPVFRNRLHPMFAVFDFPDPNLSSGKRNTSTLSTQALYFMNSPLVQEHATKAAARLLAEPNLDDEERLNLLYERAVGRLPSVEESTLVNQFLEGADSEPLEQWTSICQSVMGSVDFRYVK